MIIGFCGHADFHSALGYEERMQDLLEKIVGDRKTDMYIGGYGNFDSFAYQCCAEYKKKHPKINIVYITPYLTESALKKGEKYDAVIYPELEGVPPRFAILERNKYIVERSDALIAFVNRNFGGAYKTYRYAKTKRKIIYNLAENNW